FSPTTVPSPPVLSEGRDGLSTSHRPRMQKQSDSSAAATTRESSRSFSRARGDVAAAADFSTRAVDSSTPTETDPPGGFPIVLGKGDGPGTSSAAGCVREPPEPPMGAPKLAPRLGNGSGREADPAEGTIVASSRTDRPRSAVCPGGPRIEVMVAPT